MKANVDGTTTNADVVAESSQKDKNKQTHSNQVEEK